MCTLTHTIKTNVRRICPIIILIFKLLKIFICVSQIHLQSDFFYQTNLVIYAPHRVVKCLLLISLFCLTIQPNLLNSNLLHTTIAVLHDVQALGWCRQSLTIHGIARYFLSIGRSSYLVNTSCIIFNNIVKISPDVSKPIILRSPLRHIQSTFCLINMGKNRGGYS